MYTTRYSPCTALGSATATGIKASITPENLEKREHEVRIAFCKVFLVLYQNLNAFLLCFFNQNLKCSPLYPKKKKDLFPIISIQVAHFNHSVSI